MIDWSSLYSVGVEEIDEQHHHFFDLINEVFRIKDLDDAKVRLPHVLKELATYAEVHFAAEEKYFDVFAYERTEEHKAEHRAFEHKVKTMREEYEKGEGDMIDTRAVFMEDWLTNHISFSDKKYRKCFKEHGLE